MTFDTKGGWTQMFNAAAKKRMIDKLTGKQVSGTKSHALSRRQQGIERASKSYEYEGR